MSSRIDSVLALEHMASGKVREIYSLGIDRLLLVATDRISAFDVVNEASIPDKGRVLTGISEFWFDRLDTPHHLISTDVGDVPDLTPDQRTDLAGRSMLVKRADVIPMECVVRGYLYGSSWKEYEAGGGPTTEHLPDGLQMASQLEEPIFTPATKATVGHDENLNEAGARQLVGDDMYEQLKRLSIDLYLAGNEYAAGKGIILADTKFEFGVVDEQVVLIDEVLTPDSSRYWPADQWEPGNTVPSFDKQPVRDWLEEQGDIEHTTLAPEVVSETRSRYVEAYELITGETFDDYLRRSGAK